MSEVLTADERELVSEFVETIEGDIPRKLLRLYDAALARAEAAEREAKRWESEADRISCAFQDEQDAKQSAESRFAETTALLRECQPWMPASRTCDASRKLDAFLSVTPTQAAEPEDGILVLPEPEVRTVGKFVASGAEHPDTIALRECRSELERERREGNARQGCLESARAERDTALAEVARLTTVNVQLVGDKSTALARIEELHAIKPLLDAEKLTAALARIAELEALR